MSTPFRDFGSKPRSAGVPTAGLLAAERKERQRLVALQVHDLDNDPYFMKNHLGQYECKLCCTLHTNEGNYLAHTQGKKHQTNLRRRAARMSEKSGAGPAVPSVSTSGQTGMPKPKRPRIGLPGFRITKQRASDNRRVLLLEVDYPQIIEGGQPKHRLISTYEQQKEPIDTRYQYVVVASEPYETIAFKIPNETIDQDPVHYWDHWDDVELRYTLHLTLNVTS
ncbi:hypothetical protein GEMRC1_013239 [Eukaryota sp. GEM-RC1]